MPEKKGSIGERITFERSGDTLTVVITQQISRRQESFFFAWLMALVAVGGAFIFYWVNSPAGSSDRIFFMTCTAFVLFFLVRYGKVFLWRRIGRELIRIKDEEMTIKNAFGSYGRAQHFDTTAIKRYGVIPYDHTKFGQFMDRAFWEMGGETLGFEYRGKKIRFAKQLDDREAAQLGRVIEKGLSEIPANYRRKKKAEEKD
jgi:hypothetical protein